jgi:hypothetical protein
LDTFAKEFVAVPMVADGRISRAIRLGEALVLAACRVPFWPRSGIAPALIEKARKDQR